MKKKNFLITGGAGFLGINLVRHLLDRGHGVRTYDIERFTYPERSQISELHGDIRNRDLHEKAFEGIDIVVHCAAALPLAEPAEIMSTNIEGTRSLLQSAHNSEIERFVHISSTAVYGIPDHHPLVETDPLVGVGAYGESKVQAENICSAYRSKGLFVSVLRPKSFVGPERLGAFELLYSFAFEGHNFPVLGRGENVYQLLDVEDLNQAVMLCSHGDKNVANDTFNVGAGRFGTLRESFQAVLDRAGYNKRIIGLPAAPAISTLRLLEALNLSPLYKWIYETAAKDSFVSIEKISGELGYSPNYSNAEALVRNYEWYIDNRARISASPGVTHRVPWKKGALALIKYVM